jgi:hypothetical protein
MSVDVEEELIIQRVIAVSLLYISNSLDSIFQNIASGTYLPKLTCMSECKFRSLCMGKIGNFRILSCYGLK